MKVVLIIFFTSLVILTLVFLLNMATYNAAKSNIKKDPKREISNEEKH